MQISLVLDIIISGLLVLTIAYAVRLNQRLSQLRSDKNELLQLAKTFADATTRAESGIQQLKISSEALRAEVDKAAALKDDLAYLVERGGRAADEMVENVRAPQRAGGPAPMPTTAQARPSMASAKGVGSGLNSARGSERGSERGNNRAEARGQNADSRLIEEAIRAAMPQEYEAQEQSARVAPRDDRNAVTRRISGRPANAAATASVTPSGALATRGLGHGQDEEAIEDTQAARALLKALSAVK